MGIFNTMEGNVVDYDCIVAFIAKLTERFEIRKIVTIATERKRYTATLRSFSQNTLYDVRFSQGFT